MSPRFPAGLSVLALLAGPLASDAAAEPAARITIDVSENRGPVNPLIFGQNVSGGDGFGIFGGQHTPSSYADGLWDPVAKAPAAGMIEHVDALRMGSLRYPGGCLAHNFNWKAAVGPLAERPDFQFGIDEWIRLCRRLGAEPVFTVADYYGTAGEAAELVEYLNAPATPEHPWAMLRAEQGNPEPYNVKWFELGNETDHGNHDLVPFRAFSASEYASWARNYAAAMKAVDPTIKIGLSTPPTNGMDPDNAWNATVFAEAGDIADFVVVHFYAPYVENTVAPADLPRIHRAVMAQTEQLGLRMDQLRAVIQARAGRSLPLAITEFNTWAPYTASPDYRYAFAPALQNADFLRLSLEPGQYEGVSMTHYWHMFDGHWGALRNGGATRYPAYALFRLWGRHRESLLLTPQVDSPRQAFSGSDGLIPAGGESYVPAQVAGNISVPTRYPTSTTTRTGLSVSSNRTIFGGGSDGCKAVFTNYHGRDDHVTIFSVNHPTGNPQGRTYRMTFEAKLDLTGASDPETRKSLGEFGLLMEDSRGWDTTNSGTPIVGANMASDWTTFSGTYTLPYKGTKVDVRLRLLASRGAIPVNGTLQVRAITITRMQDEVAPAHPLLTASATLSDDGSRMQLVVFNKSFDDALDTELSLPGFRVASTLYEQLTSADGDPASTDRPLETTGDIAGLQTTASGSVLRHAFPAASMTGITLVRQANLPTLASAAPPRLVLGRASAFQIEATGDPTGYSATGLPPGVTLDPATGLLSGTTAIAGDYPITLVITNAGGSASIPVTLRVLTPFAAWLEDNLLADLDPSPPADPDGDGVGNLLEYALGLDPLTADAGSGALPQVSLSADAQGAPRPALAFTIPPGRAGLTYTVQTSPDLADWTPGHAYGDRPRVPPAGVTAELENTLAHDGARHVRVRDDSPAGGDTRRFLRLSVSSLADSETVLIHDRFDQTPGEFIAGSAPTTGAGLWATVGGKSARAHDAGGTVGGDRDWYGGTVGNTLPLTLPAAPALTTLSADVVPGDSGWGSVAFRGPDTGGHWSSADSKLWLIVFPDGEWTLFRDGENVLARGMVTAFAIGKTTACTIGLRYDSEARTVTAFVSNGLVTQTLHTAPWTDAAAVTAVGFCISTPNSPLASVDNFRVTTAPLP